MNYNGNNLFKMRFQNSTSSRRLGSGIRTESPRNGEGSLSISPTALLVPVQAISLPRFNLHSIKSSSLIIIILFFPLMVGWASLTRRVGFRLSKVGDGHGSDSYFNGTPTEHFDLNSSKDFSTISILTLNEFILCSIL